MSIIVEHDKRRREILDKALDVFMDEGFEDATFQKIADRCGITRTTLYIYFKNKREIFNFSIKQLMHSIEQDLLSLKKNGELPSIEKLDAILETILDRIFENRRLLSVIMNYLLHLSKSGTDPDYRVRKRTIRLRHILATIVIDGIRKGEIKQLNVRQADDLLYGLIEAAIFRLVVLRKNNIEDLKQAAHLAIHQMSSSNS